jgi:hypothetical protein
MARGAKSLREAGNLPSDIPFRSAVSVTNCTMDLVGSRSIEEPRQSGPHAIGCLGGRSSGGGHE